MEGQLPETDSPLSTALDAQVVEVEETQASPHKSENKEEVVGEGGALPPSKSRFKKVVIAKAMVFAVVVILVSGARYIMPRKSRSYSLPASEVSEVPLDDVSVQKYLVDFNQAADEIEMVWGGADHVVCQAFNEFYTPSHRDGLPLGDDTLEILSDHVARMRKCEVPPSSSVEERRAFVQHLHFLEALCRAVALRFEEVKSLVELSADFSIPVPSIGLVTPSRDSDTDTRRNLDKYDVGVEELLSGTGLPSGSRNGAVAGSLAYKLSALLDIEKTHLASNIVARCYFERFLPSFGDNYVFHAALPTAEYLLPYDRRQVRIGALAQAAAPIFRETDSTPNYANVVKLHKIAENWTDEGVRRAAEQQEEENAKYFQNRLNSKRKQMRALLDEGIPSNDLVMIALFLL